MNAYTGYSTAKITREDIESMAAEFEKYVNYGVGAYVKYSRAAGTYVWQDKPEIELLAANDPTSWGSISGVEISLYNTPQSGAFSKRNWILTMASQLLHEYGHHETLTSTDLLSGANGHSWDPFKDHLNPKFTTFFAGKARPGTGGPDFGTTSQLYHTPYGIDMPSGYNMYAKPLYSLNAAEFTTRVQQLLESNFAQADMIGLNTPAIGDMDLAGMYESFNGDSPIESGHVRQTIDAFKDYVYGVNKKISSVADYDHIVYAIAGDEAHKADKVEMNFTLVNTAYGFNTTNMLQGFTNKTQVDVIKEWIGENNFNNLTSETIPGLNDFLTANPEFTKASFTLQAKKIQFRFNTNFTNGEPEELVNGYVLVPTISERTKQFIKVVNMFKSFREVATESTVVKKGNTVVTFG